MTKQNGATNHEKWTTLLVGTKAKAKEKKTNLFSKKRLLMENMHMVAVNPHIDDSGSPSLSLSKKLGLLSNSPKQVALKRLTH